MHCIYFIVKTIMYLTETSRRYSSANKDCYGKTSDLEHLRIPRAPDYLEEKTW